MAGSGRNRGRPGITANHLVANATVVNALLQVGALNAVVLVRSDRDDVALLRIEADNLRALTLENPGALDVGRAGLGHWESPGLGAERDIRDRFGVASLVSRHRQ